MTLHRRCDARARRSKPHVSRRACRAPRGPVMAGTGNRSLVCRPDLGPRAVDRRPSNSTRRGGSPERSVHRGPCGASLQTPRAGRLGTGGLADFTSRARRREGGRLDAVRHRGPWVRSDPWRPARPRCFFRERAAGGRRRRTPRRPNQQGRRSVGFSLPQRPAWRAEARRAKAEALAKAGVSKSLPPDLIRGSPRIQRSDASRRMQAATGLPMSGLPDIGS